MMGRFSFTYFVGPRMPSVPLDVVLTIVFPWNVQPQTVQATRPFTISELEFVLIASHDGVWPLTTFPFLVVYDHGSNNYPSICGP